MLLITVDFNYGISYDRISILSMISCNAVIRKNHIKSMVVPLILIQRKLQVHVNSELYQGLCNGFSGH